MKIKKDLLKYSTNQKTHIFYFIPESEVPHVSTMAILTHGYTSDKSSILNWAIRLCEVGIPVALFDLPGHYLGNYSEVENFEEFKTETPKLFSQALTGLKQKYLDIYPLNDGLIKDSSLRVVLGGHSLGALLSMHAGELVDFKKYKDDKRLLLIAVGFGMAPKDVLHLFDTPFYKSTLKIREELVSPALRPEVMFPWIKSAKEELNLSHHQIHLITGMDDLVVGADGMERLEEQLLRLGNLVTLEKPTKLPHHGPELAASHVKKHLKKIGWC